MPKIQEDAHLISRRSLLQAASVITGAGLLSLTGCAPAVNVRYPVTPFQLGVASGDPQPGSVVLWTRLSLDPLGPTGAGLPKTPIGVSWEVAHDENFERVVKRFGQVVAVNRLTLHIQPAIEMQLTCRHWYLARSQR